MQLLVQRQMPMDTYDSIVDYLQRETGESTITTDYVRRIFAGEDVTLPESIVWFVHHDTEEDAAVFSVAELRGDWDEQVEDLSSPEDFYAALRGSM